MTRDGDWDRGVAVEEHGAKRGAHGRAGCTCLAGERLGERGKPELSDLVACRTRI